MLECTPYGFATLQSISPSQVESACRVCAIRLGCRGSYDSHLKRSAPHFAYAYCPWQNRVNGSTSVTVVNGYEMCLKL